MEDREEEVVVVAAEAGDMQVILSRCDSLHAKRITARPADFIFSFTVRANRGASDFFSQTCGTHNTHAPLTLLATENLLQRSSLLNLVSSEVPS